MLVKAVSGSAGLRIVGMGFGFLVGVQLARGLGAEGYGIYGTVMAVISVLMIPTELGMPQLVTREIASSGAGSTQSIVSWARRRIIASSALITLLTAILLATAVFALAPSIRDVLLIGLLLIPIVAIGNIYGAALRGLHRVTTGQLGEFLLRPVFVSLMLFLVAVLFANSLTPRTAMALNVAAAVLVAIVGYVLLKRELAGRVGHGYDSGIPPGVSFSQSLPIAMSEGMRVLAAQAGILILALMASNAEVGQYRVAGQIYAVSTMPSALVNIAFAPTLATLHSHGRTKQLERVNISASIFLLTSAVFVLLIFLLFGKQAISLAFGAEYLPASQVLMVFLTGEVVASLFGHPTVYLNMARRQRTVMNWSAISLLVNVSLVIVLAHIYGAIGAAVGTSVGLIVWRGGCAWNAKRSLGVATSSLMRIVPRA